MDNAVRKQTRVWPEENTSALHSERQPPTTTTLKEYTETVKDYITSAWMRNNDQNNHCILQPETTDDKGGLLFAKDLRSVVMRQL